MKIVTMHKQSAALESGVADPKVFEAVGALFGEVGSKLLGGEGLRPSATRARVSASGRVERGPYTGRRELIAGFCLFSAPSLDGAIDVSGRIAKALGDDGEVEVGPVTEMWDLGATKPDPLPPPRFLALAKSDAKSEAGAAFLPRIAAPLDELKRAGALLGAEGLAPGRESKRMRHRRAERTVIDGPFVETKELIAGYAVLEVSSWDEALSISDRFAKALGGEIEIDLRPLGK